MNSEAAEATQDLQRSLRTWKDVRIGHIERWGDDDEHYYGDDDKKVVELHELCGKGADLVYLERERGLALMTFVFWCKKLIRIFVDRGLDVNARDENGDTALHIAIRHANNDSEYTNYTPVIKYLLRELSADLSVANLHGETAFFSLAKYNPSYNWEVAKILVENGADVTSCNGDGESILHLNTVNEKFIQAFKGNVDVKSSSWLYSQTPLMVAAGDGKLEICRLLVSKGANVNVTDLQGYTALHHAALNRSRNCAEFLVKEMGADPNAKSACGKDPYDVGICTADFSAFTRKPFTFGTTVGKRVEILEISGAVKILKDMDPAGAIELWKRALGLCKKFHVEPSKEFLANLKFLTENLKNPGATEEMERSAMITIARSSPSKEAKFWNLLLSFSTPIHKLQPIRPRSSLFRILDYLSEELKNVEDFASLEDIDFNSLYRMVIFFYGWLLELVGSRSKKSQATSEKISQFHSIARLIVACFNKVMHATNSNKAPVACTELYLRICQALMLLHSHFNDVILKEALNDNKTLLRSLIEMDLRDNNDDSLMHLIVLEMSQSQMEVFALSLLDSKFLNVDVTARNRLGLEPGQTIAIDDNRPFSYGFIEVLEKMADRGAHVDAKNTLCDEPTMREMFQDRGEDDEAFRYDNLKCACARVLARSMVPYVNRVPQKMVDFIRMHVKFLGEY